MRSSACTLLPDYSRLGMERLLTPMIKGSPGSQHGDRSRDSGKAARRPPSEMSTHGRPGTSTLGTWVGTAALLRSTSGPTPPARLHRRTQSAAACGAMVMSAVGRGGPPAGQPGAGYSQSRWHALISCDRAGRAAPYRPADSTGTACCERTSTISPESGLR